MAGNLKKIDSQAHSCKMVASILNTICDQRRKDVAVAKETVDYPFSLTDRKSCARSFIGKRGNVRAVFLVRESRFIAYVCMYMSLVVGEGSTWSPK